MSDKPRPWPTHAAEARDRTAEEGQSILNHAAEALDHTQDAYVLERLARILHSAGTIVRLMERQGAKTRPR